MGDQFGVPGTGRQHDIAVLNIILGVGFIACLFVGAGLQLHGWVPSAGLKINYGLITADLGRYIQRAGITIYF